MKILIVDDSVAHRNMLRLQLESEGMAVLEAVDGLDALEKLEREAVDAIISDILMPRMDGYRLCREVRTHKRLYATPFIFHTASYDSPDDEKLARDLGADRFLKKPAPLSVILEALRESRRAPAAPVPAVSQEEVTLMKEYSERLVSKLKEKNASLESAINQLRLQSVALETAANAIVITDAAGLIVWANPAFTTLTGYPLEEALGNTPRLLKSGKHDKAFYKRFWGAILSGKTWRSEFINKRKDGSLYCDEHTVTPVRNAAGKITHFISVMNDVTARREAENSLKLFRTLIDRSRDGIEVVDPQTGRFLDVNDATCVNHGYTREEMLTMRVTDIEVGSEDPTTFSKRAEEIIRSGFASIEGTHRRKDGSTFPVEVNVRHIELERGYLVAVVRDVTERKRADAALGESEARFRELAETVEQVFWITDPAKQQMIYISPAYEKIWGRTCESLYKSPGTWLEAIHPDDRQRVLEAVATKQNKGTYNEEFRIVHPDGSVRWVRDRAFPVRNSGGEVERMLGVATDVTQQRRLEEQFRQSQKMEAIGQLAGGVAHDFNNILGAMLMQSDLALLEINDPQKIREGVELMRSYAERAANLTRQLLLFSRRQVMQSSDLDLNDVVTHLAKMLQRIIGEDVRLQINLHPGPLWTHADAGMLDQVLMNLSVNARDAMPQGGRLIIETEEKRVEEEAASLGSSARAGHYVCLSISDTGSGIPPEVLPHIFEPFFTTKEPGKGTGLGLATVFGIVQQHKGWIQVYSEPGHGTRFQVYLPAREKAAMVALKEVAPSELPGGTETILLVEDDQRLRLLTRSHLERRGYTVIEASNGPEAFAIWERESERIQLLLTDVVLPEGINGHQIAATLQGKRPGLKVILTSGYSPEVAGHNLKLKERQAFLQKPCSARQLLETVRRSLDEPGAG